MRVSIKKNLFLDILSKIQGITGRRSNLAITTNVILTAENDGLNLAATDLETGFSGVYPATVVQEGKIALNSRKLFEIVRDFPSEEIDFNQIENNWIEIRDEKVEFHLVGMNPDDFPEIPRFDDVVFFEVDAKALGRMIERMVMITASDDKRAHILGVWVEKQINDQGKQLLRMVTTDGSRLSKVDYAGEGNLDIGLEEGVLVPKKGLAEAGKFLDTVGTVSVGFKNNHFILKRDSETIVIRLLEGDFPKYGDILDSIVGVPIVLDRQAFLMMLKRMSILATETYRAVVFHFTEDHLMIRSTNPDLGEAKEDMEIVYAGDPIEVAFNPRFFIEALNAINEENIVMTMVDHEKPCLINGENDQSFLSVIMPMRI